MADSAFPGDFEGAQSGEENAMPSIKVDAFEVDSGQERARPLDDDGAMLGRVLVYACIITVVVAMIVWKQFA